MLGKGQCSKDNIADTNFAQLPPTLYFEVIFNSSDYYIDIVLSSLFEIAGTQIKTNSKLSFIAQHPLFFRHLYSLI